MRREIDPEEVKLSAGFFVWFRKLQSFDMKLRFQALEFQFRPLASHL